MTITLLLIVVYNCSDNNLLFPDKIVYLLVKTGVQLRGLSVLII